MRAGQVVIPFSRPFIAAILPGQVCEVASAWWGLSTTLSDDGARAGGSQVQSAARCLA
jgi:hypothetical protein